MSQKITSKNLSYDTSLPPFLARLRGQQQSAYYSDGPDPILAAQRRGARKKRSASEEAEDEPLVVDEEGNVVDLGDVESGNRDGGGGGGGGGDGKEDEDNKEGRDRDGEGVKEKEKEKMADNIGPTKKRKVGKVVGAEDDDNDDEEKRVKKASADVRRLVVESDTRTSWSKDAKAAGDVKKSAPTTKKIKKAKKIKLSFSDDDDEG